MFYYGLMADAGHIFLSFNNKYTAMSAAAAAAVHTVD